MDGETVDIGLIESMISFLFEGSFKKTMQMKETVTLTLEPVPVECQSSAGAR